MSHAVFRRFLERVGNAAKNLSDRAEMVWHGGEPLVLGVEYYAQCLDDIELCSQDRGFKLPTGIQTNAVLIDKNWINLFKKYNVQIGVSIDGPDWIHDKQRVYWNGRPTHSDVQNGLGLLHQEGIAFSVIAVLNSHSIQYPEEMYEYFRSIPTNKGFAFNIDENDGYNKTSSIIHLGDQEDTYMKLRTFFKKMVELNERYGRIMDIRDFSKY